ncbi:hypothetical protein BMAA1267 [Burkholderia mallei ATCC 23344]|uniref:Uncharacterized protein n=1 Tax=Burkholderia mallei (strain ATCC 23344) TaxID=243160 RepID=A0A0H2WD02_BURMA|nr:hypothetical protein BMAA1267 [Burkholderia mallei ATCC 23344]
MPGGDAVFPVTWKGTGSHGRSAEQRAVGQPAEARGARATRQQCGRRADGVQHGARDQRGAGHGGRHERMGGRHVPVLRRARDRAARRRDARRRARRGARRGSPGHMGAGQDGAAGRREARQGARSRRAQDRP